MRYLSVDVGDRHIGIAISDPTGTIARPLETLEHASTQEDFAAIASLVDEYDVGVVVVGRPFSLDGTVGPQARRIDRYTEGLAAHLEVPVVQWDERFSTEAAREILLKTRNERGRRRARASGEIDAIAAAVILQSYLDNRADSGPPSR